MESSLATRLKLFIDTNKITVSQFADNCCIPRPTLSQLLTGRNKKVSDLLITQIHIAYPNLSIMWLLFGEGSILVSDAEESDNTDNFYPGDNVDNLEPVKEVIRDSNNSKMHSVGRCELDYSNLRGSNTTNFPDNNSKNELFEANMRITDLQQQIENFRQNPRKVVQITIYYDDSTFETFVPVQ